MFDIISSKKLKIALIFILICGVTFAQNETDTIIKKETRSFWKQVSFGGGLGLNFSNGYTNISVSPNGLYKFSEVFGLGAGLNANYSKHKNNFEATVLGASIISVFKPINELQVSAEFQENNINLTNDLINSSENYWNPALYLGAGYSIGNFGAIGFRYDMLYNKNKSTYGTALLPFIRVYF